MATTVDGYARNEKGDIVGMLPALLKATEGAKVNCPRCGRERVFTNKRSIPCHHCQMPDFDYTIAR